MIRSMHKIESFSFVRIPQLKHKIRTQWWIAIKQLTSRQIFLPGLSLSKNFVEFRREAAKKNLIRCPERHVRDGKHI